MSFVVDDDRELLVERHDLPARVHLDGGASRGSESMNY
jgi:hypothetical protein